ncbi:hypothetical protein ACIHFB_34820 [Streptomyces sp. NPDC051963]|uniref:hypothetical protein n=1 Tax=Streptomyces sp. NPDC051963 TaxID=3365678 RepID=UPI0037CF9CA9
MRRLLTVGFLPCGLFVTCLWTLVRAGSFTGRSRWDEVLPRDAGHTAIMVLALLAGASLLAMLLQPFQVRAVRVLEGYWDRWPWTAGVATVLIDMQRRRWVSLRKRAVMAADAGATVKRVRADVARRLSAYPPGDVLLPTALGNALRAGELRAGERYGLSTLASWSRIHMQVSDRAAVALHSTRDALDAAVNLCWCLLVLTPVSWTALYDEPGLWWMCACVPFLAAVAYKGAVTVAQAYASLMHVVYDLHRFDLARALHYRLPDGPQDERELFTRVSDLLSGRSMPDLPYEHHGTPDAND